MSGSQTFWLSLIVCVAGLAVVGGVITFGRALFYWRFQDSVDHILERLFHTWMNQPPTVDRTQITQAFLDSTSDYRERRNELWMIYGQIVLSIFLIVVLGILLLTKTIDPDAGLPILSGIAGFAIAKGISSHRSGGVPGRPEKEG